jgi:HTH-type transcriptional regulator / antitoxin HipB
MKSGIVTERELNRDGMTAQKLGELVKRRRKKLGLNQSQLALASGTGRRFISDLENGKESCELGKTLRVMAGLGIELLRDSEAKGGG